VEALHRGLGEVADLEAVWVEVALAVGGGGSRGVGGGVAVVGGGHVPCCLGGAVPVSLNRRHEVVGGVPHTREHTQAGVYPGPEAQRAGRADALRSRVHFFVREGRQRESA